MSSTETELVAMPQHLRALAKANRVRLEMAAVKAAVGRREMTLREAMTHPACENVRIDRMVRWVPGHGTKSTLRAMSAVGITTTRTCAQLTERQIDALGALIQPRY